jgi:hypothetical protein
MDDVMSQPVNWRSSRAVRKSGRPSATSVARKMPDAVRRTAGLKLAQELVRGEQLAAQILRRSSQAMTTRPTT